MNDDLHFAELRSKIRAHTLADETSLGQKLIQDGDIGIERRKSAQHAAKLFVQSARANASRSGMIDKFLQEYGLSTAEGVTLMRLAEALLRTPDAATANALIEDKIEAGDWSSHIGKSPFPLINFSTRALMFTAAWLDDVEANDPARKMVAATKGLLDRVGEPVIRASVAQAMKIMGEHFVLGETIDEAHIRGQEFKANGYLFSYDMLGEAAHTQADALKYFNDYASAISAIAKHANEDRTSRNPGISVKLSALHPRYEYSKRERVLDELGPRLRDLAVAAKNANIGFNIDAEETDRLDLSLDLIEMTMRDPFFDGWDGFGVVVQAYQRRAIPLLDWLATLTRQLDRRIMVRLVKGAYWDGEIKRAQVMGLESYPVFTRKVLTDVSYAACARHLLNNTDVFYPQFATHNALTAVMVREMAGDYSDYELQRLHGMGEALHDSLIREGVQSRIYAPVGGHKELLPYLVRRLLENGANSSFVNQLIDPDLSVDDVVSDPIEEALELQILPNPAIPAPRDLFNNTRLSAKGFDDSDPETAIRLESKFAHDLEPTTKHAPSQNSINEICSDAKTAFDDWSKNSARGQILLTAAKLLEDASEDFMHIAIKEAGKSIPDAIAEIREAVDFLKYYGLQSNKLTAPAVGPIVCISPWNFPLAIFLGQVSGALAAGNTVVAKPAEQTPRIASKAVELLYKAGVPKNVLQLVQGDGPSVGDPLVRHPSIKGVIFTGSTATAKIINRALAEEKKHEAVFIAETGGINAMIIDSTALLEQAVGDVIDSAFQSAGQRCSACRLVCVQEDIADKFNTMLTGAMAELVTSNPAKLATDIGPVIDQAAADAIERHVTHMRKTAKVIAEAPAVLKPAHGTFIRSIAFEISDIGQLDKEIFGPVLHVYKFKGKDLLSVISQINDLGYGLTMGIHTRIDETMENVTSIARVGNLYVNRNQIGAVVGMQPFGGEGKSGTGPKAGGPHYLPALTMTPKPALTGEKIIFTDGPIDANTEKYLQNATAFYPQISNNSERGEIFKKAAKALAHQAAKTCLQNAAEYYDKHFSNSLELPSPTGESNKLRMRGRGIIICLGGENIVFEQIAKTLAAGNCAIVDKSLADVFDGASPIFGTPLIHFADLKTGLSNNFLLDDRIAAIAYDGVGEERLKIFTELSLRHGAIIPILSSHDCPSRYGVERTLTINTTAAGGDVRLLSLPE